MAIVVEDGTGLPTANSYASENDADDYFDDRANTAWTSGTGDKEAALIRASAALDARFRSSYPGVRVFGRDQGLEWPRTNAPNTGLNSIISTVTDVEGNEIAVDEIPIEVKQATMELAVRELTTPGSAQPDIDRQVKSVKAGSVSIDFASNAADRTMFTVVDSIMASLCGSTMSSLQGEAVRG